MYSKASTSRKVLSAYSYSKATPSVLSVLFLWGRRGGAELQQQLGVAPVDGELNLVLFDVYSKASTSRKVLSVYLYSKATPSVLSVL